MPSIQKMVKLYQERRTRKLKALVESEHGKEFRGAKPESEQQTTEYNEIVEGSIT